MYIFIRVDMRLTGEHTWG